jgi:hypothetical protein
MSIGFTEEELLSGYAAWLRWLKQKRAELEAKQAKMDRRMAKDGAEIAAPAPVPTAMQEAMSSDAPSAEVVIPPEESHPSSVPGLPSVPAGDEEVDDWL